MNTPSDTPEQRADKTLLALLTQPWWIIRTVETVTLVDRHTARRRISRHFTLPPEACCPPSDGNAEMARLPVFGIPKLQHLSCDLVDESRRLVSLPTLSERAHLSVAALQHLAFITRGSRSPVVDDVIHELVRASPDTAENRLRLAETRDETAPLFDNPHFRYLATYLARNWIVYIDVLDSEKSPAPNGHIIRFDLDVRFPHTRRELTELRQRIEDDQPARPFLRWRPRTKKNFPRWLRVLARWLGIESNIYHHVMRVDGAGSLHLELESIEGIALANRRLWFEADQDTANDIHKTCPGASSRRARFLIPRTRGPGDAVMTVAIRPGPGILRNGAPVLLLAMGILLLIAALNHGVFVERPQAISVLFLLSGLVSLVAVRPNEHPYVTDVVLGIRMLAILPVALGLITAVALLAKWPAWIIWLEMGLAFLASAILLVGRWVDEREVRPDLNEYVGDDHTRIG